MADERPITLLNPHADDFIKTPVSFKLVGRRGLQKYAYMIDEPRRNGQVVDVLIDGTLSSLIPQSVFNRLPAWVRRVVLGFEIREWLYINDLEGAVRVHWSPDTITDRGFLYLTSYKNCVGFFSRRKKIIESFRVRIINVSHYFILTELKGKNINSLDDVIYTSEYDLRDNNYFAHYFRTDRRFIDLPFAVSARFQMRMPLSERAQDCVATGSFHNLYDERPRKYYNDFIGYFRSSTYHPLRKQIYEQKDKLAGKITCCISPYREHNYGSLFIRNIRSMLGMDCVQKNYFSIDIVELYNSHVFAVVGEELAGLSAIGFFEAMACGCVTLGKGTEYYQKLNLVAGEHYLPHDGTVEGILAVLERFGQDHETLNRISSAALRYVTDHCRPHAVWATLQRRLAAL